MTKAVLATALQIAHHRGRNAWHFGLPLCAALALIFFLYPEIDLWFSGLFFHSYNAGVPNHFVRSESLTFFFDAVDFAARGVLLLAIGGFIYGLFFKHQHRLTILVISLSLILGPAITVNVVLKNHWDRARPGQVLEFGGKAKFTPAWVISDQCERNCSFTSGHAAAGFSLLIGHFISRRKGWLTAGISLGGLIGLTRIMVGGHFLSDVVFSFFVVYLIAGLVSWRLAAWWQAQDA